MTTTPPPPPPPLSFPPPPTILVRIVDGPIAPDRVGARHHGPGGRIGASVVFQGLVRREEDGRAICGLMYEVYEPMASRTVHALATEIAAAHGIIAITVEHSRGEVRVDECSFRLTVEAAHRKEALVAMDAFIDRMKKDVPIWKTPVWA